MNRMVTYNSFSDGVNTNWDPRPGFVCHPAVAALIDTAARTVESNPYFARLADKLQKGHDIAAVGGQCYRLAAAPVFGNNPGAQLLFARITAAINPAKNLLQGYAAAVGAACRRWRW